MKARIKVDRELLERFEVTNGLCKGALWPKLCLICMHLLLLRGDQKKVKEIDDVGTLLLCKLDNQLFHRSTRNTRETLLQREKFVDDALLLEYSRAAQYMCLPSGSMLIELASSLGLSISFSKTKFMVVDSAVAAGEKFPFVVADSAIDCLILAPCMVTEMREFMKRLKGELPMPLRVCIDRYLRIPTCLLILSDRCTGHVCCWSCCTVVSVGNLFTGSSGSVIVSTTSVSGQC